MRVSLVEDDPMIGDAIQGALGDAAYQQTGYRMANPPWPR